jgi:cyanophycin synthetase
MTLLSKICRRARRALYSWQTRSRIDVHRRYATLVPTLWTSAAQALGLEVHPVGRTLYISGPGQRVFHVLAASTDFDTEPLCGVCGDKVACRGQFQQRQLRMPAGKSFHCHDISTALAFALSLKKPCVIKPARDTSSGRGVSVNLHTPRQIRKAIRLAGLFCDEILVEEFVLGDNYRFLVYKGRCLSVVRRRFPHVVGDGQDSVRALVSRENLTRARKSEWAPGDPVLLPMVLDATARLVLKRQGLSRTSVPAAGQRVTLREVCSLPFGASYWEVIQETHPALLGAAVEAMDAVGVALAGVDIISPDIQSEQYWINEINTTPAIDLHYIVSNPERCTAPIRTILEDYFDLS